MQTPWLWCDLMKLAISWRSVAKTPQSSSSRGARLRFVRLVLVSTRFVRWIKPNWLVLTAWYTFVPARLIHGTELTQQISGYFPFASSNSFLNHSFCLAPIIDFSELSF